MTVENRRYLWLWAALAVSVASAAFFLLIGKIGFPVSEGQPPVATPYPSNPSLEGTPEDSKVSRLGIVSDGGKTSVRIASVDESVSDWFEDLFRKLREMTRAPGYHERAFFEIQKQFNRLQGERGARRSHLIAIGLDTKENPLVRGSALLLLGRLFPADRSAFLLPAIEEASLDMEIRHAAVQGLAWKDAPGGPSFSLRDALGGYEKAGGLYPLDFGAPLGEPYLIERLVALIQKPAPRPEAPIKGDEFLLWPDFLLRNLSALALGGSLGEDSRILESFERLLDSREPQAFIVRGAIVYLLRKHPHPGAKKLGLRYLEKVPPEDEYRASLYLDLLLSGAIPKDETLVRRLHDPNLDEMEKEAIFIGLKKEMQEAGAERRDLANLLFAETIAQEGTSRASAFMALSVSPHGDLIWIAAQRMLLEDPDSYNRGVAASWYRPKTDAEKAQFAETLRAAFDRWPDDDTREDVLPALGRYAPEKAAALAKAILDDPRASKIQKEASQRILEQIAKGQAKKD